MSLRDVGQSLWKRIRSGAVASDEEDAYTSRMDGGITGYHPAQRKHFGTSRMQPVQEPELQQAAYQPPMTAQQQVPMAAGFTSPYQTSRTQDQPGAGAGFGTSKMNFRASAPQTDFFGFQQQAQQPQPMQEPQAPYAWNGTAAGGASMPFPQEAQQVNAYMPPQESVSPQQAGYQTGYAPEGYPPQDNMRYMPGTFVGDEGRGYAATLRIAQLSSVRDCYRLIEFMRNLESVIVNVEYISDRAENQRCLDLLYGAAFAMQYTLTKIAEGSIYLISPQNVLVIPYETIRYASDQDLEDRWPGAAPEYDRGRPLGGGYSHDQSRLSQRRRSDAIQRSRRGY